MIFFIKKNSRSSIWMFKRELFNEISFSCKDLLQMGPETLVGLHQGGTLKGLHYPDNPLLQGCHLFIYYVIPGTTLVVPISSPHLW